MQDNDYHNNFLPYIFNTKQTDCQSLIHLINLYLGDNIIGAEVGVEQGKSLCTFLQQCPSINKIYGIDNFKPYADCLKIPYDGTPAYTVDIKQSEYNRLTTYHNIKYSGYQDKVIFLEKNSRDALQDIEDNSLDFIFLDTYMTLEQAREDVNSWYPKVKTGGLFAGHDSNSPEVQTAVLELRSNLNIKNKISVFDNTWVWIK